MNSIDSSQRQGGMMGLPPGMPGSLECTDAMDLRGGGFAKDPWCLLPAGISSSALHKMLAQLSYGQPARANADLMTANYPPMQSTFTQLSDQIINSIPVPATTWGQQVSGALPVGCYLGPSVPGQKDHMLHLSHHIALNGGSLVLDSARGELVNASKMTPKEILEAKALAASKSHSEAERRRRERINSHLATLRTLLPSSTKTDKASLLAEVIDQVKMLKRQVAEIYECSPMPTDHDELSVERDPSSAEGTLLIKVSVCCDDRPDLMTDIKATLDTLSLKTVKAEISTLGGRVKHVFIMTSKEERTDHGRDFSLKRVQEALRLVMDGSSGGELSPDSANKRQKVAAYGVL